MQDLKPSLSSSLNESNSIKDMQWTRKPENLYVVLSDLGKLSHGSVGGLMEDVMDNVDAGISFFTSVMQSLRHILLITQVSICMS